MPIIRHHAPIRLLVAVRGHPFDRVAFDRLFADQEGVSATMVDQPAAAQLMTPEGMAPYDALVLYDMPGLDFRRAAAPADVDPPAALVAGLPAVLAAGKGVVALHHALAGWPSWPAYAQLLGGRFLYRPGTFLGQTHPDSGYAPKARYTARVLAPHPVTAGLPETFDLCDELYLAPVDEPSVVPLLAVDPPYPRERFWSAAAAVEGRGQTPASGSDGGGSALLGWAKRAGGAPLVYLQPGDDGETYDNPHYRRLVDNAIRWVVSPAARAWAAGASRGAPFDRPADLF